MTILFPLLLISLFIVLFIAMSIFIPISVNGSPIKEEKLQAFLDKNLKYYTISVWDAEERDVMFVDEGGSPDREGKEKLPFIASRPGNLFFPYYIKDGGLIWRWSEAKKLLDTAVNEKLKGMPLKLNSIDANL